jgi:hypothetical protein
MLNNLDLAYRNLIAYCVGDLNAVAQIAGEIVIAAGSEYSLQTFLTVDDFVVIDPAKWVSQIDSFSEDKRSALFDIFSVASYSFAAGTIGETPRTRLFAFSTTLYGICRYRTPDSAEFSTASFCRQLSNFNVGTVSSSAVIEQFGNELFLYVKNSSGYWDKQKVMLACALLANAHAETNLRFADASEYIASNIEFSNVEMSINRFDASNKEAAALREMLHDVKRQ